jgi:hypothetical protein
MSMELAQEQLQNALVTTFLANLAFLNEYDKPLFQRVESLSQVINSGIYKENYELEFLNEVGDFDIYDIKNDKYLYNKKPHKFNRNALARTDFTSKGSISVLDKELFQGSWFNIFDEVEYFCDFEYSNKKLANDILNYSSVLKNNITDFKVKKYKYIGKFIFIGTLLGRHIPLISDKIKAMDYFVCEQNLELFRLSLFVVDYSLLAREGRNVIFSIMDDEHAFVEKLETFFTHKAYENYCIKYFTTDIGIKKYYNSIINLALAHKGTTFNHYMMCENVWKNVSERINKYKTIQILQKSNNELLEKPILFLGAGPSLGDNIEWLKENRHRFILVAVAATYKVLDRYDIIPDIVSTLDPQYTVLNKKHFDKENVKKLGNTYILAAINTDQRIIERFNQKKLYIYEMLKPLHKNNICYRGFSVGEMSASILLALGFKNIYLLGIDLAINQKTGSSHMGGYSSTSYDDFKSEMHREESHSFSFKDELITVKGNQEEKVYTNRLFALSLDAMSSNFALIKNADQNIYNLSNHGAFIENTISANVETVDINMYTNLSSDKLDGLIHNYLEEISKSKLDTSDYNDLQNELEYISLVENSFKKLISKKSKNFEEFYLKCEEMVNMIFYPNVHCSFLYVVFKHFFGIFLQYIFYCFNDQKIKDEKHKLEQIEKQFISDSLNLLKKYKKYLEAI